jgi:HSP20 family protein
VFETEKEFQVTLALPGMKKEDIDISMENKTLIVSGERKLEEENGRKFHHIESRFGKFSRSLPFPDIIDAEKVSANYENGVLTITVPKLKEKAAKKIPVK